MPSMMHLEMFIIFNLVRKSFVQTRFREDHNHRIEEQATGIA